MEEDLYAQQYFALLRRNWLFILVMAALAGVVGVVLVFFILPRQYRAATSVLFEATSSSSMGGPANIPGLPGLAAKLGVGQQASSAAVMALAFGTSQTVRLEIVDRLNLVEEWNAAGKYDAEHRLYNMTAINLTDKGTMAVFVTATGTPRGLMPSSQDDLEERTLSRDIANQYVKVIHEKLSTIVLTRSQRKANFLEERVEQTRQELADARRALKEAQSESGFVSPLPSTPPEINTLALYMKELAMAQAGEAAASDELAELKELLDEEELMLLSSVVTQRSSIADRLKEDVAQAAGELAALHDQGYSDETPECVALLARIDSLQRARAEEIDEGLRTQSQTMSANPVRAALRQRIANVEGQRAASAARASAMSARIGEVEARIANLPGAIEQLAGLLQEVQVKTAVYEVVTNAYEMARVEAAEDAPQFTVLDEAIIPPRKMAPSGLKTCLAMLFAGLVLGVALAPGCDRWRQRRQGDDSTDET